MTMLDELNLSDLNVGDGQILEPLEVATLTGDEDAQWNLAAAKAEEPFLNLRVKEGDLLEVMSPCYRKAKILKMQRLSCIVECRVMTNDITWQDVKGALPEDHWVEQVWQEVWAVRDFKYRDPQHPDEWLVDRHCVCTQENRPKVRAQSSIAVGTFIKAIPDEHPQKYWRVPDEAQPGAKVKPPVAPVVEPLTAPVIDDATAADLTKQIAQPVKYMKAVQMAKEAGVDISDIKGSGAVPRILQRIEEHNGKEAQAQESAPERAE